MTVKELITMLQRAPEDAVVKAWDDYVDEAGDYRPVSGAIFENGEVLLQTDEEP